MKAADQTATWPKFVTFGYTGMDGWDASYENKMAVQAFGTEQALRLVDDVWTGNTEAYYAGTEYANWNYRANTSTGWDGRHAAFVVDTKTHRSYRKGCCDVVKPRAGVQEMPAAFWMIGSTYYNGSTGTDQLVGTMKAVRAYGRVLTDGEISRHYAIDTWRFDGETPVSNAVVVVADVRGLAGREPAGVYFPLGWTFSAGAQDVTVDGQTFRPSGYVVEAWDADTRAWRVVDASDDASGWTAPAAPPFASRRLTWIWRHVCGARMAADYGIGDYVQGGLVAWLDGIRNAGAANPHADDATTWTDLSVRGDTVTLRANDASGWTGDGYRFDIGTDGTSPSYAYFDTPLSLGENGTIEIVSQIDHSKQNKYGVSDFVGRVVAYTTGTQSGTFYDTCVRVQSVYQNSLNWNADNWSGTPWQDRVNVPVPWDGKYATFVMDATTYSSYARGVLAETKPRASVVKMPALWWMVGNKYNASRAANQLTGTVKALRVYNRPLSADEIAHNHKVDAARFDGRLIVTNVVVAGVFAAEAGVRTGAYEVDGTHTFTAGPATEEGGKERPVLGYALETWNGTAWTAAGTFDGASYTYTRGTDPATVRVTWRWRPDGLAIVVR